MSEKMKNLVIRSVSGVILGVVMLGAIAWTQWSFGLLLLAMLIVGMYEFYTLCEKQGVRPQRLLGTVAGVLLFTCCFLCRVDANLAAAIIGYGIYLFSFGLLLFFVMFICELFRGSEHPAANIGTTLMGVCYVALPVTLLFFFPSFGPELWNRGTMIAYVFIIWANDVFAYLVGMAIGRRKLFERISPKKSWEGFFGGVAGAIVVGLVAGHLLGGSLIVWAGLALVAAVTGVLGDLTESMFKRAADVKDSGATIPGHGGMLDRFDAMLLSAPFVFIYMFFVM